MFWTLWTLKAHQAPLSMEFSKNTGVGSHSLLQGVFQTQGSNLVLLNCRQTLYSLFTLLIVSFVVQKLLSFIRSHLFIFAFISNILDKPQMSFPGGTMIENLPTNARDSRDSGSIPGSGRSLGGRNGNPFQYSCLKNSMDRGAWQESTVLGVAKCQT